MSRRRNVHYQQLETYMADFAAEYDMRFEVYSAYHMRLMDGFTVLDVWTTGKYYVLETNYYKMAPGIVERGTEKGYTPTKKGPFILFLHKLFFPVDYL